MGVYSLEDFELLLKQCERQKDHAVVNLKHSGNDIGRMINNWTYKIWEQKEREIRERLVKVREDLVNKDRKETEDRIGAGR